MRPALLAVGAWAAAAGAALASDPWPKVSAAMERNGCRITEQQLVEILENEGNDIGTVNIMVTNFADGQTVRHDATSESYTLHNFGTCQ